MSGMIFDIKHFAVHDGDGIRTTVFFKGCGLKCIWCHNPESISGAGQLAFYEEKCTLCGKCEAVCRKGVHKTENRHLLQCENCVLCGQCEKVCPAGAITVYGREVSVSDIMPELLEDLDFYQSSGGGVTLSGGECLLQPDFCAELLRELKKYNIHTAVDTCGFAARSAFDKVMPYTDVFLYDIKAIDEAIHIKCTGQSNRLILENLKYLDSCGQKTEIRIPYVPDYNADQMQKIADFLSTLKHVAKVKVLPYHKFSGSKYQALRMKNTLPEKLPTAEEIEAAKALFRK